MDEDIFLDVEQILPPPSTEDYQIKLGKKNQEAHISKDESVERYILRKAFWTKAIPLLAAKTGIYNNCSPTKDHWLTGASGHSGIGYTSVVLLNGVRSEFYLGRTAAENKAIFKELYSMKDKLEAEFGAPLHWELLENKIASRISISMDGVSLKDENDWPKMIDFLGENISKLIATFKKPLAKALQNANHSQIVSDKDFGGELS